LIEKENINVEKDIAYCINCNNAFSISKLFNKNIDNGCSNYIESVINNPPKGTWKIENNDNIIIGASTKSIFAFFIVPFVTIWIGILLTGFVYNMIVKDFSIFLIIILIPFFAVGIIFGFLALKTVAGKIEICIGKNSYVFNGIGQIGFKQKFDWSSVVNIYEDGPNSSFGRNYYKFIYIEGKNRIKFGGELKEDRKYYILNILKYLKSKNYVA
jgi:hypothetical protein